MAAGPAPRAGAEGPAGPGRATTGRLTQPEEERGTKASPPSSPGPARAARPALPPPPAAADVAGRAGQEPGARRSGTAER